jgi:hypothetical protein
LKNYEIKKYTIIESVDDYVIIVNYLDLIEVQNVYNFLDKVEKVFKSDGDYYYFIKSEKLSFKNINKRKVPMILNKKSTKKMIMLSVV